jgi:rhodanese-related sulfurtransferase
MSAAHAARVHRRYSLAELRQRLRDPRLAIVNALPLSAWEEARIPGSLSLPLAGLPARARGVLPDFEQEIVTYCGGPT